MNNNTIRQYVRNQAKLILENLYEQEDDTDSDKAPDKPEDDKSDAEASDDEEDLYTHKSMVVLFNAIRSGQSMKNKKVVSSLEELWNSLDDNNKKETLKLLAKIAKIVSKSEDDESEETVDKLSTEPAKGESDKPADEKAGKQTLSSDDATSDIDFDKSLYGKKDAEKDEEL